MNSQPKVSTKTLIGPFIQLLTLRALPYKGALKDEQLEIIPKGGVLVENGYIISIGNFDDLYRQKDKATLVEFLTDSYVGLPGFIDCHTHLCFAGSRALDYAARNNGQTYLEIAALGGGIWSTVEHTRKADIKTLLSLTQSRLDTLIHQGVTTVEIKSGYGLNVLEELKILRILQELQHTNSIDIISTCLAAHIVPKDIADEKTYLDLILKELVPIIQKEKLCKRFDIFIEQSAFSEKWSTWYLQQLAQYGFEFSVHGDQFTTGGSKVAINCKAFSVDHLECSTSKEIQALSKSDVIPVALPGASIGLGCAFTPSRKLLDMGCSLAIASDWNPGSAPLGYLLTQAAILGSFEKLSTAEIFAAITFRAAKVLNKTDIGILDKGMMADIIAFPTDDYREILYHQGALKTTKIWKKAKQI